jgi:glucosamine--fructose-6-phosphate aminotransferase (isomerizing)
MCGIVGIISNEDVVARVVEGLRRLEYRGYDSAGVAVITAQGALARVRSAGKIARLEAALQQTPVAGNCGIGHTRWATHGRPTDENAHPHASCRGDLALVHNGIIENYQELRKKLRERGHELRTETDTEVLVHLVEDHLAPCGRGGAALNLMDAVMAALREVRGVHAVSVIHAAEPDRIVAATNGPPAIIGLGDDSSYIASDLAPILPHARRVIFLEEGDVALVTRTSVEIHDATGARVERVPRVVELNPIEAEKGGYKHFMLKEIHEQPRTLNDSLVGHVSPGDAAVMLEDAGLDDATLCGLERVTLIGCGTSWHAGLVGKYLVESLARMPCDVEIASEYRQRDPIVGRGTMAVAITQSGETADTIAAMKEAKARGARMLTVCNVLGSMATRVADGVLHTRAGIEIGVASTKAFTAQILALTLLAVRLGQARGTLGAARSLELVEGLRSLPRLVETMLLREPLVDELARATVAHSDYLFLGRGILYPVALEGALKLKEISYVHAEGYPAGEMKHGPIALIDDKMPVVGLCLRGSTYDKMLGNLQEVKARDGILIAVVTEGDERVASFADHVIPTPPVDELLAPVVASIPLQLLAYHVAVRRGCDVDQPRNLAKSVTVE